MHFFSIAVVHESVSLVVSRQILTELCNHIPNMESSTAKEVSHFVLDKLQPRAISFEEQVCNIAGGTDLQCNPD